MRSRKIRMTSCDLRITDNLYGPNRVGVIVSKRIHKRAVVRNRIRRVVYEIVQKQIKELNGRHDILCLVKDKKIIDTPFVELQKEISENLNKL